MSPPTKTVDAAPCASMGYVVQHTKKGILLSGSMALDDDINIADAGRHGFIPSGMIRSIKILK
jgi:hypothetical protein